MSEEDRNKEAIITFINSVMSKNSVLLDILWVFVLTLNVTSESGYWEMRYEPKRHIKVRDKIKDILPQFFKRNIKKKYALNLAKIDEYIRTFSKLYDKVPNFLDNHSEEVFQLTTKLLEKSKQKILKQIDLESLSELEKDLLTFLIVYLRIDAEFEYETLYIDIDPVEMTKIFNLWSNNKINPEKIKPEWSYLGHFCHFGDILLKLGIGYWILFNSASDNSSIEFFIPKFIYDYIINELKIRETDEAEIQNMISRLKKEEAVTFKLGSKFDFQVEPEIKLNNISETDIENYLIDNLDILEEGLELIGQQYPTPVGPLDLLCKDKNGNYVIIELRREKSSDKVVGQIQRYMAWISENLSNNQFVRGIIVVKELNKELEYSTKISKFPIDIQVFGGSPPIEENIIFCDECGKQKRKTAKFCKFCGQELWMQ